MPPFDATNHLSLAVKINAGKFARIPAKYSEDLHRAIRWMLTLEVSHESRVMSQPHRTSYLALTASPTPTSRSLLSLSL